MAAAKCACNMSTPLASAQGTEDLLQGETVEQQFGEKEVCFRNLDLYTSAVLEASLNPSKHPKKEYREAMAKMAKVHSSAQLSDVLGR